MIYKIWMEIEEIDDDKGHYESLDCPVSLRAFDTLEEAVKFQEEMSSAHYQIIPQVGEEEARINE